MVTLLQSCYTDLVRDCPWAALRNIRSAVLLVRERLVSRSSVGDLTGKEVARYVGCVGVVGYGVVGIPVRLTRREILRSRRSLM
jgi:hypothetical protein